jgi:glycosyltransferase involved in cell wall biosynthesis
VDNQQVKNLLESANVFALACRTDSSGDRDGIPVVLMEAMACGVPVISGDLPAIRELVVPGVSGLLVDSSDTQAWAKAFDQLATDQALRSSLTTAGRAMVQQEFDLETNVSRLASVMEKTVRKSRGIAVDEAAPKAAAPLRRYALITPCRDEAKYARRTLDSVLAQTILPAIWVIVDDGSKDETPKILAEYAEKHPFIRIVTRPDRGDRKLGGGVIDAFYAGYETLNPGDYDYVCKFDLDLDLPPKYFQTLMERMEENPRLGTTSGKPFYLKDGKVIPELCGDENSVGMVKFYRTECFTQIGGFVRELMWDGIDCHRCRQLGWIAVSWSDPGLSFEHLRPMGTSHKSWWTGRVRHGVGQYFMGTGPTYMLASGIFRMAHPPILIGGIANLWGYTKSALQRKPRYGDKAFRKFLRSYQWSALLRGKRKATALLNDRQARVWNPQSAEA